MSGPCPTMGKDGVWSKNVAFRIYRLKEAAAAGDFDTSQVKTDTPTLTLNTNVVPDTLKVGFINRIHFRLNFANAATYTLRLWQAAIAGDYESNLNMLWESPAARADDIDYDETELNIPFILAAEGVMFFSIEWTAACGNIQGFIEVSGETLE